MKLRSLKAFVPALVLGTTLAVSALANNPTPGPTPDASRTELVRARFGATVDVRWDASGLAPRRLSRLSVATTGRDAAERAATFVRGARDVLALDAQTDVEVIETRALGKTNIVQLRPTWRGLPVEGRTLAVTLDGAHKVTSVTSDHGPLDVPVPVTEISAEAAQQAVTSRFAVGSVGTPKKVVVAQANAGRVAWKVPAVVIPLSAHFDVWVDVGDASILRQAPVAADQAMKKLPLKGE